MTIQEQLLAKFGDHMQVEASDCGDEVYVVDRAHIFEAARFMKEECEPRFEILMDLTAVDYKLIPDSPRFAVIYQFYALSGGVRIRFKTFIPETDPIVDSVVPLWDGANWLEREVWDMFGIKFKNHPDPRRILMYDEFKGHPLRKDYPFGKRQPLVRNDKPYVDEEIREYNMRVSAQNGVSKDSHQVPLSLQEAAEKAAHEGGTSERSFLMNMGPSHPAMHGVIHILLEIDGEYVKKTDLGIGYLHRAFEKESEVGKWSHVFPYTDRLNYVSPLINNVAYAMAVEKLLGLQITERAEYIRVIMSEISRISDHLTCVGANAMELGAMSVFLYLIQAREELWGLVEEITGARLTVSYVRIGGIKADLTPGFHERARKAIAFTRKQLKEADRLLTRNRIFVERMQDTGVISREDALSYGFTGPCLRSTGVDFDVRKNNPYSVYPELDFEIPYGEKGDNFDRYLCRMAEMEQSCRIVEQALEKIPEGPLNVDYEGKVLKGEQMADKGKFGQTKDLLAGKALTDPTLSGYDARSARQIFPDAKRVVLPPKEKTYGSIEGVMNHFMLVMDGYGIQPPPGEAYSAVEGANGELGFFIVSTGEDHAYRVRVRPPCFALMSGFHKMLEGDQIADIVASFGTINMIAGELDR